MRSVFDLVSTVPEAKGSGSSVALGGGQGGSFGATLDGISVNTNRNADTDRDRVPDAVGRSHHRVLGGDQRLQAGIRAGRRRRHHVRSKSGTNKFQARSTTFLRNDALDEKGFFEAKKGIYRQNNFGASWGGPVQIPARVRRQEPDVLSLPPTKASRTVRHRTR
jgi:hypothetical protein